jgi:transcriptional regulator with XRE-family HTH domain
VQYFYCTMNTVKKTREAKGLRREELAVSAGISVAYVFKLESDTDGSIDPGLDIARRLSDALGVPLDKLFPRVPVAAGRAR